MSTKEKKGIRDYPEHKRNPALPNLIVPTRNKTVAVANHQLPLFDGDTGEVIESAFIGIKQKVDKEEFIKIYKGQLTALFGLKPQGQRVFAYFMSATRISADKVYFDTEECKEYTEYKSANSINLGIINLLELGFIYKTGQSNIYFINPSIFFNGDRMVLVNEYVKKGTEAAKKYDEQVAKMQQMDLNLEAKNLAKLEAEAAIAAE